MYIDIVVTNTSNESCAIKGYPSVVVVDENNNTLGKGAKHNPVNPVARITLDHARSAHASIGFPTAANHEPGTCTEEGAGINVTLPTGGQPHFFPWRQASCPGFSVSAFSDWE